MPNRSPPPRFRHLYRLHSTLEKDYGKVATQQARYARQAHDEKAAALRELRQAQKLKQKARAEDARAEADICEVFYKYRTDVSRDYQRRAAFHQRQAKMMARRLR